MADPISQAAEAAHHGFDLTPIVVLLAAAVVAVPIFRRAGLGSVLGYLAAGLVIGRSTFRDWAGDCMDYPREIAEAALAHALGSEIEKAYRRSDALSRRRALMMEWQKYCDGVAQESPPSPPEDLDPI